MQLLSDATMAPVKPDRVATQLIETVPLVMQFMRRQTRRASKPQLSIPQLRTLYFVSIHDRPSLSCAADFIGLSLPAMSRLIDVLVRKGLVSRAACENDRRHVRLAITADGRAALDVAWKGTHARLKEEIEAMTVEERAAVACAMEHSSSSLRPGRGQ